MRKIKFNFRFLFISLSFLFVNIAFAQKGNIAGIIKDAKTKESIPGAAALIVGTTQGVLSDDDGNFAIENLPVGKYTLKVSFVGYASQEIPITVEMGKTTQLNIALSDGTALDVVTVTAKRETNTAVAVVVETRKLEQIAVGISAQQISRGQDRDAGQIIRRLPGISIANDRFVNIRGLAERYNVVMLNDIITPSTEVDVRSFSFDLIPSSAIDRMLVFKTGSAELPGDFAGGVIKIYTKAQLEENATSFGLATGFRNGVTGQQTLNYQGSSTDFLGFDNGMRQLPSNAPSKEVLTLARNPQTISFFKGLPNFYDAAYQSVMPDFRASFALNRKMTLGGLPLSSVNAVNYSFTHELPTDARQERYQGQDNNQLVRAWNDTAYTQNARLSLLSNWSLTLKNGRIQFRNLFNQIGWKQTLTQQGRDQGAADIEFRNYAFRYIARSIYSGQVSGLHNIGEKNKLTWNVGYGYTNRSEPDYRLLSTSRDFGTDQPYKIDIQNNSTSLTQSARFYSNLQEHAISGNVNLERKLGKVSEDDKMNTKLRVGLFTDQKSRVFDARWFGYINPNNLPTRGVDLTTTLNPPRISTADFLMEEGTNADDKYDAQSTLIAPYIGAYYPINENMNMSAGIRGEWNRQALQSFARGGGSRINVDTSRLVLLPSLIFSYNLSPKSLFRFAYSMTVNRPEFRELAPFSYYDFDERVAITGNPSLKWATVQNADFRYEYYPSNGELLTVALFYKYFATPIERAGRASGNGVNYVFMNPNSAASYGVEVEMRKTIRNILDDRLSVVANASLISSRVDASNLPAQIADRQLQGQSPYLVNLGLYYNHEKWQASILYNVIGPRIYAVGDLQGNQTIWEMPRHVVDANVAAKITKRFEVRLGVQDLLNQPFLLQMDANSDNKIDGNDKLWRQARRGTYSSLTLNYQF